MCPFIRSDTPWQAFKQPIIVERAADDDDAEFFHGVQGSNVFFMLCVRMTNVALPDTATSFGSTLIEEVVSSSRDCY